MPAHKREEKKQKNTCTAKGTMTHPRDDALRMQTKINKIIII